MEAEMDFDERCRGVIDTAKVKLVVLSEVLGIVADTVHNAVRGELAAYAHRAWSRWMEYLFKCSTCNSDGSVTIPRDKVERWKRQMSTDYHDLSSQEQQSDLSHADDVIEVLRRLGCHSST